MRVTVRDPVMKKGWFLRLFKVRTWISFPTSYFVVSFCVQSVKVGGDNLIC